MLAAGLGIAALLHRSPSPAATQLAHLFKPAPTQITFSNEDDRVIAEAISPDGKAVAYSNRFGISIHSLDNGNEALSNAPPLFSCSTDLLVSEHEQAGAKRH